MAKKRKMSQEEEVIALRIKCAELKEEYRRLKEINESYWKKKDEIKDFIIKG